VATQTAPQIPIEKIVVRVKIGSHRMAASDDPFFLSLSGDSGREFRLLLAKGKSLRRGAEECYVFGPPDATDTNVAHAELNDPTTPALDLAEIERVSLRKRTDPIPNVRGVGELDDRLELEEIEVELYGCDLPEPRRYRRAGPLWLGLTCGLAIELARVVEDG
jgi:hypothetical protein